MTHKLFTSSTEVSFSDFVETPGQCFYVPAYQRYYVWDNKHVIRFFQDTVAGIRGLIEDSREVTFIGTMTCFHDTRYVTIEPKVRQDVPAKVINVVDGQQRLTTLMICSIILHNYIRVAAQKSTNEWLCNRIAADRLHELHRTFEVDMGTGDQRYYPKMIRAFDDQWSKDLDKCRYHSPLSHLIASYGTFLRESQEVSNYVHKLIDHHADLSKEQREAHDIFDQVVKNASLTIKRICENDSTSTGEDRHGLFMPSIQSFFNNQQILNDIFNLDDVPSDVGVDISNKRHQNLIRALLLSSYLLKRVHFVSLIAPDETHSLEIFESLNTTGQILTALETFKPEVIRFEGLENYAGSRSKGYFDSINEFIGTVRKPDRKKALSSEIVTNFALAENGKRLSYHLDLQRSYLRKQFMLEVEKLGKDSARNYVQRLMSVSHVVQHFWNSSGDPLHTIEPYADMQDVSPAEYDAVNLCLKYLQSTKHTICRPLLSRFHYAVITAATGERNARILELFKVIKATAAFFALWRSSRQYTENIDDYHRELMEKGIKYKNAADEDVIVCKALCHSEGNELDSAKIIQAYRYILSNHYKASKLKVNSCESFKAAVDVVPLYRSQRETAKFILLVATHDSAPEGSASGHLIDGTPGVRPLLTGKIWDEANYETVEHIIPQSASGELDVHPDRLHCLGNLTLLSNEANSILSNLSWHLRKIIYAILATRGHGKIIATVLKLKEEGHLSNVASAYFTDEMKYTPMTEALGGLQDFTKEHITPRTSNLAERAWKVLANDWLEMSSDGQEFDDA